MTKSIFAIVGLLAAAVGTMTAQAADAERLGTHAGTWQKAGFTHVNFVCWQEWTCERNSGLWPNGCSTSASTTTRGACSANGGPIDSCQVCEAPSPASACTVTCP